VLSPNVSLKNRALVSEIQHEKRPPLIAPKGKGWHAPSRNGTIAMIGWEMGVPRSGLSAEEVRLDPGLLTFLATVRHTAEVSVENYAPN
jgi:hypothetical protein